MYINVPAGECSKVVDARGQELVHYCGDIGLVVGVYLARASQGHRIPFFVVRLLSCDGQVSSPGLPSMPYW